MTNRTKYKSLDRIAQDPRVEDIFSEYDGVRQTLWVHLHPAWAFTGGSSTLVADSCRELLSDWKEESISRNEDQYLDEDGDALDFARDLERAKWCGGTFDQMQDCLEGMTASQRQRFRAMAAAHHDEGTLADLDMCLQQLG